MASTYGRRVPTWENEDIKEIYSIVQEFGDVTRPGTWLAETIPPLADLPTWMQWWRPAALKYQDHQSTSPKFRSLLCRLKHLISFVLFNHLTCSAGMDEVLE